MPIIDKPSVIRQAFIAARSIHAQADWLLSQSGSISFETLWQRIDGMEEAWDKGVQPLLDLAPASVVNSEVSTFFAGAPAQTHQAFVTLRGALDAFGAAYKPIFDNLTPITYTAEAGHAYAAVSVGDLSSLADEVTAIRNAANPLKLG